MQPPKRARESARGLMDLPASAKGLICAYMNEFPACFRTMPVIEAALSDNCMLLGWLPSEMLDKRLVMKAVRNNGAALLHIGRHNLLWDPEVILEAASRSGRVLELFKIYSFHPELVKRVATTAVHPATAARKSPPT